VSGCCRLLEGIGVHPKIALRAQHQRFDFGSQVAGACFWVEGLACGVERLAQVVGGAPSAEVPPKQVHPNVVKAGAQYLEGHRVAETG